MASRGIAVGLSLIGFVFPALAVYGAADEVPDPSVSALEGFLAQASVVGSSLASLGAAYLFLKGRAKPGLVVFATAPLMLIWGGLIVALPHIILTVLIAACGVGWEALTRTSASPEAGSLKDRG